MDLVDLFKKRDSVIGNTVTIEGWIRNHRKQKEFGFIDFSDGTCQEHLQVVYDKELSNFDDISKLLVGFALRVTVVIVKSEGS